MSKSLKRPHPPDHANDASVQDEADGEMRHCHAVCRSFQQYAKEILTDREEADSHRQSSLSLAQQTLLESAGFLRQATQVERCVKLNQAFLGNLLEEAVKVFPMAKGFELGKGDEKDKKSQPPRRGEMSGQERVQSTLKQLVRDWSSEGSAERALCYTPIIDEVVRLYSERLLNKEKPVEILFPGAGLARLPFEFAQLGFHCEANEFSMHMLFAANLVLNKCPGPEAWRIYPHVHQQSNNLSATRMTREIPFPDIDPNDLSASSSMSMVAGDFLEVYSTPEYRSSKDVVITCFFIDCARNVLDFIQLIHAVLRPGGRWVNLGPLLYHYADLVTQGSIEPPYEAVRKMIVEEGFEFEKESTGVKAKYCQDESSMMQYEFKCVMFTCVKK